MVSESCGKCAPCRTGSRRALDLGMRLRQLPLSDTRLAGELIGLMKTVEATSLCGFGQGIAAPVMRLAELARADSPSRTNADV
jgi:NADH:ubiquinone oxidoreductase subunit F (NADH-binding)